MSIKTWIAVSAITLVGVAQAFAAPTHKQEKNIVETAVAAGSFKTLVAAVKAADLVDALNGNGPFTVFAPTDQAFKALEKKNPGILEMLLKPENKAKLKAILLYHVVSGKVLAADALKLKNGTEVKTLGGESIAIHNKHGVKINNATVIKADIECSNGVIHVINKVLLPK
jgi:uncharacterized surface protein with fasciclin (FAS1) repeats